MPGKIYHSQAEQSHAATPSTSKLPVRSDKAPQVKQVAEEGLWAQIDLAADELSGMSIALRKSSSWPAFEFEPHWADDTGALDESSEIERVKASIGVLVSIIEVLSLYSPRPNINAIRRHYPQREVEHEVFVFNEDEIASAPWEPTATPVDSAEERALAGAQYDNLCHLTGLIGTHLLRNYILKNDRFVRDIKWISHFPVPVFELRRESNKDRHGETMHDVLHLHTITGKVIVVDITGAQFGYDGWFTPYEEYVQRGYIEEGSEEENDFEEVLSKFKANSQVDDPVSRFVMDSFGFADKAWNTVELSLESKSIMALNGKDREEAFVRVRKCCREILESSYRRYYDPDYFE